MENNEKQNPDEDEDNFVLPPEYNMFVPIAQAKVFEPVLEDNTLNVNNFEIKDIEERDKEVLKAKRLKDFFKDETYEEREERELKVKEMVDKIKSSDDDKKELVRSTKKRGQSSQRKCWRQTKDPNDPYREQFRSQISDRDFIRQIWGTNWGLKKQKDKTIKETVKEKKKNQKKNIDSSRKRCRYRKEWAKYMINNKDIKDKNEK